MVSVTLLSIDMHNPISFILLLFILFGLIIYMHMLYVQIKKKYFLYVYYNDYCRISLTSFLDVTTTGEAERPLFMICPNFRSALSSASKDFWAGEDPNICTIKLPPAINCTYFSRFLFGIIIISMHTQI